MPSQCVTARYAVSHCVTRRNDASRHVRSVGPSRGLASKRRSIQRSYHISSHVGFIKAGHVYTELCAHTQLIFISFLLRKRPFLISQTSESTSTRAAYTGVVGTRRGPTRGPTTRTHAAAAHLFVCRRVVWRAAAARPPAALFTMGDIPSRCRRCRCGRRCLFHGSNGPKQTHAFARWTTTTAPEPEPEPEPELVLTIHCKVHAGRPFIRAVPLSSQGRTARRQ